MAPKQLQTICACWGVSTCEINVGDKNHSGTNNVRQSKARIHWGARGNSVFWGETQSLYGAIHTQCLCMESDINNRGGGRDQKRAPTPWFQFVHLITLLSVAAAPAIMLSQVMVRRRTRISYNSDGVQNTIYWEDTRYERESKRCQRINWGCSTRTNIVMTCFDHMFCLLSVNVLQILPLKNRTQLQLQGQIVDGSFNCHTV